MTKSETDWAKEVFPSLIFKRAKELAVSLGKEVSVFISVKPDKGGAYAFLYDEENRTETILVLGRFASNPELSFTWYDVAVLSQKIRQEGQKQCLAKRFDFPSPQGEVGDK